MADTAELERALVNADAAGDTAAARILANEIVRMRGAEAAPDKYQQAAMDEAATMKAQGIDTGAGYTSALPMVRRWAPTAPYLLPHFRPLRRLNAALALGKATATRKLVKIKSWAMLAPIPALPVPQQSYLVVGSQEERWHRMAPRAYFRRRHRSSDVQGRWRRMPPVLELLPDSTRAMVSKTGWRMLGRAR
jgi:hypothetical protein